MFFSWASYRQFYPSIFHKNSHKHYSHRFKAYDIEQGAQLKTNDSVLSMDSSSNLSEDTKRSAVL